MQSDFFIYVDNLFFNIFSYLPGENVANFLNKYSNIFHNPVSWGKGKWVAYPDNSNFPERREVTHSMEFDEHPHIPFECWKTTLVVFNRESEESISTYNFELIIDYYEKANAFSAFNKLKKDLEKLTSGKKIKVIGDTQMIEFTKDDDSSLTGVSMIFGKNNFAYEKYRLVIYPEAYRIDFNDYDL